MNRAKWTEEQPSGGTPSRANGVLNVARGLLTIASQRVALVTDAPKAGPFTATTSGFESCRLRKANMARAYTTYRPSRP